MNDINYLLKYKTRFSKPEYKILYFLKSFYKFFNEHTSFHMSPKQFLSHNMKNKLLDKIYGKKEKYSLLL